MTSTSTMTGVNTSNLRQSARRTNPLRTSRATGRVLGTGTLPVTGEPSQSKDGPIGFYPAITYFTDAITALPREFRRHTSLLKEVDAKAWGPEERLLNELDLVSILPHPRESSRSGPPVEGQANSRSGNTDRNSLVGNSVVDHASQASTHSDAELLRRERCYKLRMTLSENLLTIDEKIHVLGEATTTVNHQLQRLEHVLPQIENEISEEARWGNLNHWAYSTERPAAAKPTPANNERSRREINHAPAIIHETDAASRSELRREAVQARKQRNQPVDSDFDDPKSASKRPNGASKTKKPEIANDSNVGLGISATVAAPKRRKVEKSNPAGTAMERTLSGSVSNNVRGASKEPLAPEVATKKRRAPQTTATNGARKRNNPSASGAGSPNLASSPVVGSFANTRDHRGSPHPSSVQRPQSSRARQNSTQDSRQRPSSSASNNPVNGSIGANTPELNTITTMTGKSAQEIKASMKETVNVKGDKVLEDDGTNGDIRGGIVVNKDKMKREEQENNSEPPKMAEQFVTSRGRTSKTSTPVHANFPEPRSRPSRNVDPPKRSHKKGAGVASQLVAAQIADDEGSSMQGDDEEDDEDAPKYCYCEQVSFGDMIACDNHCEREWFHLGCVGLQRPPPKSAKWYCDDCKEMLKKTKSNNGR